MNREVDFLLKRCCNGNMWLTRLTTSVDSAVRQ